MPEGVATAGRAGSGWCSVGLPARWDGAGGESSERPPGEAGRVVNLLNDRRGWRGDGEPSERPPGVAERW